MSKYIVIEIQTQPDGQVGNLVSSHETKYDAESTYHSVLAAAAISALPKHAATLIRDDGTPLEYKCYEHAQPEPEPEPEADEEQEPEAV